MNDREGAGKYVKPELTEARLSRQWARISSERRSAVLGLRALAGAAALATMGIVALFFVRAPEPASAEGTVIETGATTSELVTLPDGSSVRPDVATRVEIRAAHQGTMHLVLAHGAIELEVAHREARSFVVSAGDVDVRVRGTKFRVAMGADAHDVTVSVAQGSVEVCRLGAAACRLIVAGESLRTGAPGVLEPPPPAKVEPTPAEAPVAPAAPARTTAEPTHKVRPRAPYAALGTTGFDETLATASPEALFELADEARLAGAPRDAARAFDRLRHRYRTDPRAGLAAFQLGRLRLDLGDATGAAEALTDALALGKRAPFREDAEARLVEALDAAGPSAAGRCAAARAAYLAAYPRGVHAAGVARRCPSN
jgi:hypothetical protein